MNKKIVYGGILVAVIIAISGVFLPITETIVGGVGTRFQHGVSVGTNTSPSSNGLKVGDNDEITKLLSGTCTLLGTAVSHIGNTAKPYDCAVTGAESGDNVVMQFASTTGGTYGTGMWSIISSGASSTDGYITAVIANLSSTTEALGTDSKIASSTTYLVTDGD